VGFAGAFVLENEPAAYAKLLRKYNQGLASGDLGRDREEPLNVLGSEQSGTKLLTWRLAGRRCLSAIARYHVALIG
jgi:hypothetical protein